MIAQFYLEFKHLPFLMTCWHYWHAMNVRFPGCEFKFWVGVVALGELVTPVCLCHKAV